MLKVNTLSGFGKIAGGGGSSGDLDADAFLTATGLTGDATISAAVGDLVVALKADGIWTKCIAIYPFVGGTATTHKYNLKDPQDTNGAHRISWGASPTHDANGYTANTSSGHGDTNINASSHLTLNSTHLGTYIRNNVDANYTDMGAANVSVTQTVILRARYNGVFSGEMYDAGTAGSTASVANGNSTGFYLASRRSSTDMEIYKNGSSVATQTGSNGGSLPNLNIFIGCVNYNASPTERNPYNYAFITVGTGLTDTEAADYYTHVQAFQTALSRNV